MIDSDDGKSQTTTRKQAKARREYNTMVARAQDILLLSDDDLAAAKSEDERFVIVLRACQDVLKNDVMLDAGRVLFEDHMVVRVSMRFLFRFMEKKIHASVT